MLTTISQPDLKTLISAAALRFIDVVARIQQSQGGKHEDGVARVVLTGGGAGIGVLKELAHLHEAAALQGEEFPALAIDWSRVHVFFGDERDVPVSHPDSNEGQARTALLNHVPIPEEHIHGYGLMGPSSQQVLDGVALSYQETIQSIAPKGFDLHLLGMGGEGHINSLFPHSAAVREDSALVVAVTDSPKPPAQRVSLTLPAINSSTEAWLLVAGAEKAEAANAVQTGSSYLDWPAAGVQATDKTLLFLAADAQL